MHLTLVPKRVFNFDAADFDVPIPADVLAASREDAPTADTPFGLEDFRYFLTDAEAGDINPAPDDFWSVALADFAGDRSAGVVPLVTERYARTMIQQVFALWQAARTGRQGFILEVERVWIFGPDHDEDGDTGLSVRLVFKVD